MSSDRIANAKLGLCCYVDEDIRDDFVSDLDVMINTMHDDHVKAVDDLVTELKTTMTTKLEDYKQQIELQKIQNTQISKYIKDVFVIRQYTNELFNKLYNASKSDIDSINLDYLNVGLQRPNVQEQHTSVKYALCVLHDKYVGSVSKGLCEMYLKLNDMCHPKTNPAKDKVISSINSLENGFKDNNIPSIFINNKLSYNNLEELRTLVNH